MVALSLVSFVAGVLWGDVVMRGEAIMILQWNSLGHSVQRENTKTKYTVWGIFVILVGFGSY